MKKSFQIDGHHIFLACVIAILAGRLCFGLYYRVLEPPDPAETLSDKTQLLFWTDVPELAQMPTNNPQGIDMTQADLGRRGYAEVEGTPIWFVQYWKPKTDSPTVVRKGGFTWMAENFADLENAWSGPNLESRPEYQNAQNHLPHPSIAWAMLPLNATFSLTSDHAWISVTNLQEKAAQFTAFASRDKTQVQNPAQIRTDAKQWRKEWPILDSPNEPIVDMDNNVHFQVHFWNFSAKVDAVLKRFDDGLSLHGTLRNDPAP